MPATRSRGPRSSLPLLQRLVLGVFADGTVASRADVTAQTGLSRAVVTRVLTDLLAHGHLAAAERPHRSGGPGRPAAAYRLSALIPPVALVRLGHRGQPATMSLVDHDGTRAGVPIDTGGLDPWVEWSPDLRATLDRLETETGTTTRHVVLSVPFPVRDPRPAVAEQLTRPVLMVNDANLAALGETHFGAARGRRHVLHLSVRDGIGAGLVFDGELFTGANGTAGELAHVQVAEAGPYCQCGNRGCLATQTLSPLVVEALTSRYARPLTFEDVDRLVSTGDAVALRFFSDLGALVARPLASVLTVLDPDVVVIDSQLGAAAGPFINGMSAELALRCMPSLAKHIDVISGSLPDPIALGAVAAANVQHLADHAV